MIQRLDHGMSKNTNHWIKDL